MFNNWKKDKIAQEWLKIMWYSMSKIEYVKAVKINWSHKADLQVQIKVFVKLKDAIDVQNISAKLVSNKAGFNQIDKRQLKKYNELRSIPSNVYKLLQYFSGELKPYKKWTRDKRRMFITEFMEEDQRLVLDFFERNKVMIVSDILKGRGEFAAERMLVVRKTWNYDRVFKPMNQVMNFYGNWDVLISPKWSINLWRIGIQRKWGDNWRESAKMLQFKIDPTELFTIK